MTHNPAFELLVQRAKEDIQEISVREVKARLDRDESFSFIDVREDHEWQKGYAQGAIHIGRGILERDIERHIADKHAAIVLHCGGGYRSALAAINLLRMGYTQVRSLAGGFKAWTEAGYPVEPSEIASPHNSV